MKEIENGPNHFQFGVAYAAASLIDTFPRQIYVLPCGTGKSRVAITIAFLLLTLPTRIKNVHMVFLNEVLLKKDQEDFKKLRQLMPLGNRI